MECILDYSILDDLDKAVEKSKEITNIVGRLQSSFYTNDETLIEDYLELLRTYSKYALDNLDNVVSKLNEDIAESNSNVIKLSDYQ
tara:strand:- start:270 stop:527 length:258 start_codon:yes stop_codon:yes gene_type:complete